jgi:hypothetical protein
VGIYKKKNAQEVCDPNDNVAQISYHTHSMLRFSAYKEEKKKKDAQVGQKKKKRRT